ncbi:hypothetical protein [Salipiger sp. PrR002]|uniref:hypothetical protein n=1 Tax=Salipiger sp. PrR002 TaxID=2706489 RepID=UPI0013BD0333|nr:hypothetical protein [Salipiger sp. PrR002]NDW00382.1 hypothetical protein [Salipiger sp. PrR002]NDW59470.1 hypothetical protein [Salipiger sp. PrR004]
MADSNDSRSAPIGVYDREEKRGMTGIEIAALVLSALWLVIAGGYVFTGGSTEGVGGLRFLLVVMVVFLPIAMIWVAAMTMRASRIMREESARLQTAIEAIRKSYLTQAQTGRNDPSASTLARKLDEVAAAQRKIETTLAMLGSTRAAQAAVQAQTAAAAAAPEPAADDQPALSLGTPAEALEPPLANTDFIRALNFPDTAEDLEGFAALRRALKDRQAAQLIQASQDVLTLLSQDGIYMDDLTPDMARPEVWRAFAKGTRGREVAALGGVRDRASLALSSGRMKQDAIFKDVAHHFLRLYDRAFVRFEGQASDAEITELANTRTARAFMLLGRVAGAFD